MKKLLLTFSLILSCACILALNVKKASASEEDVVVASDEKEPEKVLYTNTDIPTVLDVTPESLYPDSTSAKLNYKSKLNGLEFTLGTSARQQRNILRDVSLMVEENMDLYYDNIILNEGTENEIEYVVYMVQIILAYDTQEVKIATFDIINILLYSKYIINRIKRY